MTRNTLGSRIKALRVSKGLTQEKLAEELGISRQSLLPIEKDERKVYAEELIKLSKLFGVSTDILLDLEKEIEVELLHEEGTKKQVKESLRISVPQKNVEKFKEALLYILGKVGSKPNVGQTVIYKLLYFIDFDYYEKFEEQLIGATYIKNHHGPTPVEFAKIVEEMQRDGELEEHKSEYFSFPQTKYLPRRPPSTDIFSGKEIEHIDNVLDELSSKTATQISDYSHGDIPWLTTEDQQIIDYESVFYRLPPYSVRSYDKDDEI